MPNIETLLQEPKEFMHCVVASTEVFFCFCFFLEKYAFFFSFWDEMQCNPPSLWRRGFAVGWWSFGTSTTSAGLAYIMQIKKNTAV